jgi:hypothetical protein
MLQKETQALMQRSLLPSVRNGQPLFKRAFRALIPITTNPDGYQLILSADIKPHDEGYDVLPNCLVVSQAGRLHVIPDVTESVGGFFY